eukprot:4741038-Ditylum_brightwellii.AAC.1
MEEENNNDTPDWVVTILPSNFNASAASPMVPLNPISTAGPSPMPPPFRADRDGASLGTWGSGIYRDAQPPHSG